MALAILPVLLAACDGSGGEVALTPDVDTLADGGVFVRNARDSVWTDHDRWRLVEDLRIGAAEGRRPDVFGSVPDLTVDDAGRIWVIDGHGAILRVFDSAGRFVRSVGREGEGPGEFRSPRHIVQGPDGHVWVSDFTTGRFLRFDTAGRHVGTRRRFAPDPRDPIIFDATGALLARQSDLAGTGPRRFVVRYDPAAGFETLDTIPEPPPLGQDLTFTFRGTSEAVGGRFTLTRPVPFVHQPDLQLLPNGWGYLAWPGGELYRFGNLELSGDTVLMIERAYVPVAVPDSVVERRIGGMMGIEGLDRDLVSRRYPPFDAVHRAPDGHWWVRRTLGPGMVGFEVFDPDGVYLGRVESELDLSRFTLMHLGNDALYGVWRNEVDVPYVVRLRVERSSTWSSALSP